MFVLVLLSISADAVDLVTLRFKTNKHPPLANHDTQYAYSPALLTPPLAENYALHYESGSGATTARDTTATGPL